MKRCKKSIVCLLLSEMKQNKSKMKQEFGFFCMQNQMVSYTEEGYPNRPENPVFTPKKTPKSVHERKRPFPIQGKKIQMTMFFLSSVFFMLDIPLNNSFFPF